MLASYFNNIQTKESMEKVIMHALYFNNIQTKESIEKVLPV